MDFNKKIPEILNKIKSSNTKISDGFPYKRLQYNDKDIHNMMKKLRKYKFKERFQKVPYQLRNVDIETLFLGEPLLIMTKEEDYEFNILSDMFNEECRMKCKLLHQEYSTYEFYEKYGKQIREILLKNNALNNYTFREVLYYLNKECTSHRPTIIITMINFFKSKCILDISAGWGDRLIGAIAMNKKIEYYCATDPNPCLHKNYDKIIDFFGESKEKYNMIESTFEDADIPKREYDLVFTSPPYMDLEIYVKNNKKQSMRHKGEEKWFHLFLKVVLNKAWNLLKNGGIMAININQKNRGEHYVIWMIEYMAGKSDTNYLGVISYANEKIDNPQPIFIWKKFNK